MPGILEPVGSQNIVLSDTAQAALKKAGYDIKTFDELVSSMISQLGVASQLKSISERLDNLTAENLPSKASTYGLKSGSVEASKLGTRKATVKREGDKLIYDYDNIIKGIPSEMAFAGASTVITGANGGSRTADQGNTGVMTIPSNGSSMRLDVNIQVPNKGMINLSNSILVPEEDGEHEITLGVNDYTTSITDINISEHLKVLSAEVAALKQKVSG